ncbi:hypothetical protein BSKO_03655 [Bryopsis sp. KO-2023]|nr:hypothetical protein BSKO_03655 [Bryopsis sp. KO-2023]
MQRTTSGPIGTCAPVRVSSIGLAKTRGHVSNSRRGWRFACRSAVPASSAYVEEQDLGATLSSFGDTLDDNVLGRCRALVLDVSWRPVGVVSWKRALCLHILEKVEVLEFYDVSIRSVAESHPLPAVLRARFLLKHSERLHVPLSKRNIFLRDSGKCVYCGETSRLTVDHVVPISKGGPKSWENVVTACDKCNSRKGDKTLKQLGWKLKKKPRKPSAMNPAFRTGFPQLQPAEWGDYLSHLTSFKM